MKTITLKTPSGEIVFTLKLERGPGWTKGELDTIFDEVEETIARTVLARSSFREWMGEHANEAT